MRIMPVNKLTPGMKLGKAVYYNGNIILNYGVEKLHIYKNKLLQLGINYVHIDDEFSKDIVVDDIISEETRQESVRLVKNTMEGVHLYRNLNVIKFKSAIGDMINEIVNSNVILTNLVDINSFDNYTFEHSVNVAVISLLLGKLLRLNKDKLIELGFGAILHDIGKVMVPQEIINKKSKLDSNEYEIIKEHSSLGYNYLKKFDDISSLTRSIVLAHHERIDGSGYPNGLKTDDLHLFAKIVAIADVFDALTSNRVYRKRWPISETIDYLISNAGTKFDQKLVELFIKKVAIYPNGTTVILSNGKIGIIFAQNPSFPSRPIVKVIKDVDEQPLAEPEMVNLLKQLNLTIVDNV